MVEYKKGYFAKSKAGHDHGKIYIIIEGTHETGKEDIVMVADGITKTVDKPKKKRTKHLQIILKCDELIFEKMTNGQEIQNEDIKAAIGNYINHE
jgi:translation elongation factor EF-G